MILFSEAVGVHFQERLVFLGRGGPHDDSRQSVFLLISFTGRTMCPLSSCDSETFRRLPIETVRGYDYFTNINALGVQSNALYDFIFYGCWA